MLNVSTKILSGPGDIDNAAVATINANRISKFMYNHLKGKLQLFQDYENPYHLGKVGHNVKKIVEFPVPTKSYPTSKKSNYI